MNPITPLIAALGFLGRHATTDSCHVYSPCLLCLNDTPYRRAMGPLERQVAHPQACLRADYL